MRCGNCGRELTGAHERCPYCGASVLEIPQPSLSEEEAPSMKWYHFLIWFWLFFTAAANIWSGFSYISGLHYGTSASAVYDAYPALRAVDVAMGVVSFGFAVFALVLRNTLDKYKKIAPKLVHLFFAGAAIVNVVYSVVLAIVLSDMLIGAEQLLSAVVYLVLAVLNYIYFHKRRALFVN